MRRSAGRYQLCLPRNQASRGRPLQLKKTGLRRLEHEDDVWVRAQSGPICDKPAASRDRLARQAVSAKWTRSLAWAQEGSAVQSGAGR